MTKSILEKQGGGKIIGRLAGLLSRPFVGPQKSRALESKIIGGITSRVNEPLEKAINKTPVPHFISKAVQVGMTPVPGTPKGILPVMHDSAARKHFGNWMAEDAVHEFAHNPELVGALAIPAPGVGESYLALKKGVGKVLGIDKRASGDMLQYFHDHPEKAEARKARGKSPIPNLSTGVVKTAAVAPYQQKTQWTCSAACLKAVLAHYGCDLPEFAVIQAVGAKKGRGAECYQIADAARALGFLAFEYSFSSIEQARILLDQDIPIICDIQSFNNPGKGHYVVMTAADETTVHLMDPNTPGNVRSISVEEMDQRWWDHAMAPPHELMPKWGIVVVPPEGQ